MADFKTRPRKNPPTQIVIHENGGPSRREGVIETLRTRKDKSGRVMNLGTHFIVDWDGSISKHADPLTEIVSHVGGGFNETSVGFDGINPVQPKVAGKWLKKIGFSTISAKHMAGQEFVVPSVDECEGSFKLITSLINDPQLNIPNTIPGLSAGGKLAVRTISPSLHTLPGVFAHGQMSSNRVDGIFHLIYFALRRSGAFDKFSAYQIAQEIDFGVGSYVVLPEAARVENVPLERQRLQLVSSASSRDFQGATDASGTTGQRLEIPQLHET
jgi:hypothetical protein